jgi:hypothetical protein
VFEWDPQWWRGMPPVPENAQRAIADLGEMGMSNVLHLVNRGNRGA